MVMNVACLVYACVGLDYAECWFNLKSEKQICFESANGMSHFRCVDPTRILKSHN